VTEAKLHPYQAYAAQWIIDHPYCALLLDMGLGKTLTTLTALGWMIDLLGGVNKTLIVAPLSVARNTWPTEVAKWDHTKHLTTSLVLGTEAKRIKALNADADLYITNRENVTWLVNYYKQRWPFDTVVIDELSSFKSSNATRFRALRKVRPKMQRVIGLTGTPAPNSLMDLWPEMYLLDQGKRLGKTITGYRRTYFHPGAGDGHIVYKWELDQGAEAKIYDAIGDIAVSMKAKDYLKLPPRTDNTVLVELKPGQIKQYRQLEKDFILEAEEDGEMITASNAAVLTNKLLQLANGAIYDDDGKVVKIHDQKIDALKGIIAEAQGQPVLVFYNFKHDLSRILEAIPEAKAFDAKSDDVERWNHGEIPVMLAQPQSAGHGLNLQQGGHIIVWFGLTWSLEYYQQANARLDRQGQTQPVIVHHLVTQGTIDQQVLTVLQGKAKGQNALLEAVKARIKEAGRK
jgi:SNF2 family DNA or RNA helicase